MDLTNLFFAQNKTVEDCVAPLLLGPVINIAPRRSKVSLALIGFSFTATTQQAHKAGALPPPPSLRTLPLLVVARSGFRLSKRRRIQLLLLTCALLLFSLMSFLSSPPLLCVSAAAIQGSVQLFGPIGECAQYRVL